MSPPFDRPKRGLTLWLVLATCRVGNERPIGGRYLSVVSSARFVKSTRAADRLVVKKNKNRWRDGEKREEEGSNCSTFIQAHFLIPRRPVVAPTHRHRCDHDLVGTYPPTHLPTYLRNNDVKQGWEKGNRERERLRRSLTHDSFD